MNEFDENNVQIFYDIYDNYELEYFSLNWSFIVISEHWERIFFACACIRLQYDVYVTRHIERSFQILRIILPNNARF